MQKTSENRPFLHVERAGYEIPFTRHFYKYTPLRPLEDIEAEITALEQEIQGMLKEVMS